MLILVACEHSGVVRRALRARGHEAWSCDLLKSDDDSEFHHQGDVEQLLKLRWDMMIAHPPCTYLSNSGARWLYEQEGRWDAMREGGEFFRRLLEANIPRIAIENPIMHGHGVEVIGRKHDQLVQPYMFGHLESKATCLWLKGLPLLQPTENVQEEMMKLPIAERNRVHHMAPGPARGTARSKTYEGIAAAMAEQWA